MRQQRVNLFDRMNETRGSIGHHYNRRVSHDAMSLDTTPDAADRQVQQWQTMSAAQKLALTMSMSRAVRDLALAGIHHRHPAATPREQLLRLALVLHGPELALAAYPDIATLEQP